MLATHYALVILSGAIVTLYALVILSGAIVTLYAIVILSEAKDPHHSDASPHGFFAPRLRLGLRMTRTGFDSMRFAQNDKNVMRFNTFVLHS